MNPTAKESANEPYAVSFERYRRLLGKLLGFDFLAFEIPTTSRILDVGCGYGNDIRRLHALGYRRVAGVEPDPICVEKKGGLEISQGTMERSGFPDASFDVVLVDNVFHHVGDCEAGLKEIARVLKPRGHLCFIEPRNSIARRGMDFLTFRTPLPHLSSAVKTRHDVMSKEMETGLYPRWLKSHEVFLSQLGARFDIQWLKRTRFFFVGKATRS